MAKKSKKYTTAAELRARDTGSLETSLAEAKEELFNLRFQNATGQLNNTARLRAVRKDIARIYTVMREIEMGIIENDAGDSAQPAAEEPVTEEANA